MWHSGKESACQCKRHGFNFLVGKSPWRKKCNSLPYSCLENPMGRGAWWITVHRVTKSGTQLSNWKYMHNLLSIIVILHILTNKYYYFLNVTVIIVSTHASSSLTSTIWELDIPRQSYGMEVWLSSFFHLSSPLILLQCTFPEVVYKLNVCK